MVRVEVMAMVTITVLVTGANVVAIGLVVGGAIGVSVAIAVAVTSVVRVEMKNLKKWAHNPQCIRCLKKPDKIYMDQNISHFFIPLCHSCEKFYDQSILSIAKTYRNLIYSSDEGDSLFEELRGE